jgi:hypothetical protein
MHHYLFHTIRNAWNLLNSTQQQQLRDRGWVPPRPTISRNNTVIEDNDSGEDFLYMHRQMIKHINNMLSQGNYEYGKNIVGWKRIPGPNDRYYPVPANYTGRNPGETRFIETCKSDVFFFQNMRRLENYFKNTTELRNMTLGQLGARIEFRIHNQMHARWSSSLPFLRYESEPFWNLDDIGSGWDTPSYDWLVDTYSSHVNIVFWKLHGWIDDRINDWQKANNLETIEWKGTWMGPSGYDKLNRVSEETNHNNMFTQILSEEQIKKNEETFKILRNIEINNHLN